jgi:hypothetical protein
MRYFIVDIRPHAINDLSHFYNTVILPIENLGVL